MEENKENETTDLASNEHPERVCKHPRFTFLEKRRHLFLLLLSGAVLTALTLVLTELWLFEWITLIPTGIAVLHLAEREKMRFRTWYGYGLVFFWGFYIIVFHWFVSMYPLSFTGLSKGAAVAVIFAGVFGLSLLQAAISAFAFIVYGFASKTRIVTRYPFLRPFLFAGCWTIFEWFQNFGWWGVPWGRLAIGQIESSFHVQTAELFGSYWISFLLIAVNLCIAYAVLYIGFRRIAAITACGLFTANLICGTFLFLIDKDEGEPVKVAAIQGNISNKWDFDTLEPTKEIYRKYTLLAAEEGADIIVWSETALPYDLGYTPSLTQYLKDLAVEADAILLVGAFRSEETDAGEEQEFNSVYAFLPDGMIGETVYDKQQLVPFGEFVPLRKFVMTIFPPLANIGMLDSDLTRGDAGKNISTEFGELGCMVCFDSIYEAVALSAVQNGAELLCLSSNDAWFLDSAAIYMHHDQARLRAIETGRYLVRSGNSGITSVISPTGAVLTEIEPLTEGYVLSDVYLRSDRTLYSVIGNVFVYVLIGGIAAVCVSPAIFALRDARNKRKSG